MRPQGSCVTDILPDACHPLSVLILILNPVMLSKAKNQCNRVCPKDLLRLQNDQSIEDALHGVTNSLIRRGERAQKRNRLGLRRKSANSNRLVYFERFEDIGNGI